MGDLKDDEELRILVGSSAYRPMLVIGGRVIRTDPVRCSLTLAALSNIGKFQYDRIAVGDDHNLKEVFKILANPLEQLFSTTPVDRDRVRPLRNFNDTDVEVVRSITAPIPPCVKLYFAEWFKVPKADQKSARLIQDLSSLSRCLQPPKTPFTPVHLLIRKILRADAVLMADFKNYFYQIPVKPDWYKWLAVRVADRQPPRVLKVLPMGLAVSVFIAHVLSLAICREAVKYTQADFYDAWVDNLIFGGSLADMRRVQVRLQKLQSKYTFAWSDEPAVFSSSFEFLGFQFTLGREASVMPTHDVKRRLLAVTKDRRRRRPLRQVLSSIGLAIWANWALGRAPLCFFSALLRWLSEVTREAIDLDSSVELPDPVAEDLVRLALHAAMARLVLQDLDLPGTPDETLFSDASFAALGAVALRHGMPYTKTWVTPEGATIFAREALACLFGIQRVSRALPGSVIGLALDNLNLFFALRRGHSSNEEVNVILCRIFKELVMMQAGAAAGFVPTHLQLADFPSRFRPLPENWEFFFNQPITFFPIPNFKLPST